MKTDRRTDTEIKEFLVEATNIFSDYPIINRGSLIVVPTTKLDEATVFLDRWRKLNPGLALIDKSVAMMRVPIPRAEEVAGAIWDPNLLSIDTHQLMQSLLRAFFSNGANCCAVRMHSCNAARLAKFGRSMHKTFLSELLQ